MKQFAILLLLAFFSFAAPAQKEVRIDVDQINVAYSYPPVLKEFTKSTTFKILMPTSLNYHAGAEVEGLFNPYSFFLNGKLYPAKTETEYTITVKAMGLTAAESKGDRMWEKKIPGQASVNGYLRDYHVYFPCSITITTLKEGVLKQIQVYGNNSPISITLDKGMLQPALRTSANPDEIFQFSSPAEIERLGQSAINKVLERAAAMQVMATIKNTLEDLFANVSKEVDMSMYANIRKKKREFVFDDFDAAIEKYKLAMTAIKTGNPQQADTLLPQVKETFLNMLNSHEPRIDKNVQEALQCNIMLCCFWQKNYKEAAQRLQLYKQTALAKWETYSYSSMEYRLARVERRNKLAAAVNVVLN